jgi:hypothetical protein
VHLNNFLTNFYICIGRKIEKVHNHKNEFIFERKNIDFYFYFDEGNIKYEYDINLFIFQVVLFFFLSDSLRL